MVIPFASRTPRISQAEADEVVCCISHAVRSRAGVRGPLAATDEEIVPLTPSSLNLSFSPLVRATYQRRRRDSGLLLIDLNAATRRVDRPGGMELMIGHVLRSPARAPDGHQIGADPVTARSLRKAAARRVGAARW